VRAGDSVMLRSPAEILSTLDEQGRLEGVPFMPEMLDFFGRPFRVEARVERACDTASGQYTGVRRLRDTVLLDDLRCDGGAHAGCGNQCRLYWKEAWLRPADSPEPRALTNDEAFGQLERLVRARVHAPTSTPEQPVFRCQATELLRASEPVGWWSVHSFVNELTSGNVGVVRFVSVMARIVVEEIGRRLGLLSNHPFRPQEKSARSAPSPPHELQLGQLVQVRPRHEIGRTLTPDGKNRGLWFDREMVPFCGKTARVKAKVERFIDEGTGRLIELSSDCYILEGVVCDSARSEGRWFCPRAIYPWWRGAWLDPVESGSDDGVAEEGSVPRTEGSDQLAWRGEERGA
jgi:hypothetical protein